MRITDSHELHFAGHDDRGFLGGLHYEYHRNAPLGEDLLFDEVVAMAQEHLREKGYDMCVGPVSADGLHHLVVAAELADIRTHHPKDFSPVMAGPGRGSVLREAYVSEHVTYQFDPHWLPVMYAGTMALALDVAVYHDEVAAVLIDGKSPRDRETEALLGESLEDTLSEDVAIEVRMASARMDYERAQHALGIYADLDKRYFS